MILSNSLSRMLKRAQRLVARGRKRLRDDQTAPTPRRIDAEQLEDRVLFNAAPIDLSALQDVEQVDDPQAMQDALESLSQTIRAQDVGGSFPAPPAAEDLENTLVDDVDLANDFALVEDASSTDRREIVFIDRSVEDYETLVDDLRSSSQADRFDIVFIQRDADGIAQISGALAGRTDYDAIHIVSHGNERGVRLGETWLSGSTLGLFSDEIASWGSALNESGDLLFYGCELAESSEGRALLESVSELCDCDVAASSDDTGQAVLGGDWDLEFEVGTVETQVAFSQGKRRDKPAWNRECKSPTEKT